MRLASLFVAITVLPFVGGCTSEASSPAGTYVLEIDTTAMPKEATPDQIKMAKEMMQGEVKLNADKTLEGTMQMKMGAMEHKSTMKGTWKLDGSTITMSKTEEDGKKLEKPDSVTGTWKDGTITAKHEVGGQSMTIVMKRK